MLHNPNTESEGIKISHKYRITISLLTETATHRVAFVYIPPCWPRRLPCTSRAESQLHLSLASSEEFNGRPESTRDSHRDRVQVAWRFLRLINRLFACNKCSQQKALLVTLRELSTCYRAFFTFQTRCTTSGEALSTVPWVVTCLRRSMKFRRDILLPSSESNENLTSSCSLFVLTVVTEAALASRKE
jgi:hypothetical protein